MWKVELQEINFQLNEKNWSTLDSLNNDVINQRIITSSHKRYVSAIFSENDQKSKIKIRLKGDKIDHYNTTPPSYRVKTKKGFTILGANKLSFQALKCRNFPMEWMYHKLLASENVLSLKMDIVKLKVNNVEVITTYEEHFTHYLTDRFNRPRGTIICISEEIFWDKHKGWATLKNEEKIQQKKSSDSSNLCHMKLAQKM